MLIPSKMRIAGAVAIGLIVTYMVLEIDSCRRDSNSTGAVAVADQHHESAVIEFGKADVYEQQAKDAAKEVERLKARLAALSRPHPVEPGPGDDAVVQPVEPDPVSAPGDDCAQLRSENGVLRELVNAQDRQIVALNLECKSMRNAYQHSAGEAVQLRAALAAKDGVARSQRWLGRFEGLAVGIGADFVVGRL